MIDLKYLESLHLKSADENVSFKKLEIPHWADSQLVLEVAYDGTNFRGFSNQNKGTRTVQAELEQALSTLMRRPVNLVCAGRTDAGVHASAQLINTPLDKNEVSRVKANPRKFLRSLIGLLPEDVTPNSLLLGERTFSARFSIRARSYRYLFFDNARFSRPVLAHRFCWAVRDELSIERMQDAAQYIVGTHDFKSFCKSTSAEGKNTVREVFSATLSPYNVLGEELIALDITGNAFLHSMVRTIAGTLARVGSGDRDPLWVKEVIKAQSRVAAGEKAPAKGLIFDGTLYDQSRVVKLL